MTPEQRAMVPGQSDSSYSLQAEMRKLDTKRRRDIAFRFIDSWRAVREETGYGAIEDAATWARRIVEGTSS